jgi:hypothetical protein
MEAFFAVFVSSFAPVLGTIMTGLVSWGAIEITKYIRTKTKNEAAHNAISQICHTVETTVVELNQTMVPAMQKAATDGKITKEEAEELKDLAMERINNQIPIAMKQTANLAVNSVSALISGEIEKAVGEAKRK